jgi:hypothetical protein
MSSPNLVSASINVASAEGSDPATLADRTPEPFVWPPLDLSKSQFRLLELHPRQYGGEINVEIDSVDLPALPLSFKDEEHLAQLNEVYQALSAAVEERSEIQYAELLRWQRLHNELRELYENRLVRMFLNDPHVEYRQIPADSDPALNKCRKMKDSFIALAEEYQKVVPRPFETHKFQAWIGNIDLMRKRHIRLPPDYEAISYFCGNQTEKVQIVLNDASVDVPATAAHALRGLRYEDRSRILWIDALCIDQGNTAERAHQVLQLSKIYSCATRTLVWLGEEDDTLTESFSTSLGRLQRTAPAMPSNSSLPKDAKLMFRHQGTSAYVFDLPTSTIELPYGFDYRPRETEEALTALVALLSKYLKRPWFSRLWMYQEVLLAQECVCCIGSYELEWSHVQRAFESTSYVPGMPMPTNVGEFGRFAPWVRRMFASPTPVLNPNDNLSLKQLLLETVPLKCSDDRDKVYALLGLTRWSKRRETIPPEVWPNYRKSVTECMRDATCAVICEDGDLECLLLRTLTGPKPTWMIPWHRLGDNMNVLDHFQRKERVQYILDCSNGRPLDCDNMRLSDAPDSLFLRGLRFRRVAKVSSVSSEKDIQNLSILARLRILMERIDDVTGGKVAEASAHFARMICYTVCSSLHGFTPNTSLNSAQWTVHREHPSLREGPHQEQERGVRDGQCDVGRCSTVEETDNRYGEKEQHDASSSEETQEWNSPERLGKIVGKGDTYRAWSEDRQVKFRNGTAGADKTPQSAPKDRYVLHEDIDLSSDDSTTDHDKAASVLYRLILTLQDNWYREFPLDVDTSDLPGLENDVHLNSSLNHCLTKSRFYIPSPDWSETTPVEQSIGIGPSEMELDDQVAILFGCKRPVILRPQDSSWLHVGQAYSSEMMDGKVAVIWEILHKFGEIDLDSEVFEIR